MEIIKAIKKISLYFLIPEAEITRLLNKDISEKKVVKRQLADKPEQYFKLVPKTPHRHENCPAKIKYFFLEEDFLLLLKKLDYIKNEIQRIGDEVGESCAESESYHDNFCYEEGSRQQRLWKDHLRYLQNIKNNSEVIQKPLANGVISIGSIVDMLNSEGEIITKRIGSYINFSDDNLSYDSPIGKALIGKSVNHEVRKKINNKEVHFIIKAVK